MRTYIFTQKELEALEQFINTRKRNPTVNKLIYYIKRNKRLLVEVQLLLELIKIAYKPRTSSRLRGLPGRPPKLITDIKKAV